MNDWSTCDIWFWICKLAVSGESQEVLQPAATSTSAQWNRSMRKKQVAFHVSQGRDHDVSPLTPKSVEKTTLDSVHLQNARDLFQGELSFTTCLQALSPSHSCLLSLDPLLVHTQYPVLCLHIGYVLMLATAVSTENDQIGSGPKSCECLFFISEKPPPKNHQKATTCHHYHQQHIQI